MMMLIKLAQNAKAWTSILHGETTSSREKGGKFLKTARIGQVAGTGIHQA